MNAKEFSLALGDIGDKYLNEAIAYHCEKKPSFATRHKWLTRVACVFIVVLLSGTAVLAYSAEARAAFFGWVRQQYGNFYEYFFDGEVAVTEAKVYELGWFPENLELIYSGDTAGGKVYIYDDETDALIQFSYISEPNNEKLYVDGVDYEKCEATINGNHAEIYISTNPEETNGIIWADTSTNTLFSISGNFDKDTLIKMAENVKEMD